MAVFRWTWVSQFLLRSASSSNGPEDIYWNWWKRLYGSDELPATQSKHRRDHKALNLTNLIFSSSITRLQTEQASLNLQQFADISTMKCSNVKQGNFDTRICPQFATHDLYLLISIGEIGRNWCSSFICYALGHIMHQKTQSVNTWCHP